MTDLLPIASQTPKSNDETPLGSSLRVEPHKSWLRKIWDPLSVVLAVVALVDLSKQLVEWAKFIHEIATQYAAVREFVFAYVPLRIPHHWHDTIVLLGITLTATNLGYRRNTKSSLMLQIVLVAISPIWFVLTEILSLLNLLDRERVVAVVSRVRVHHVDPIQLRKALERLKHYSDEFVRLGNYWGSQITLHIHAALLMDRAFKIPLIQKSKWAQRVIIFVFFMTIIAVLIAALLYFLTASPPVLGLVPVYASVAFVIAMLVAWRWVLLTSGAFLFVLFINEIYLRWLTS